MIGLESFKNYQKLIAEIDRRCEQIRRNFGEYIACKKGCEGNCCQRHISVYPIEAAAFANALKTLPKKDIQRLKQKARKTTTFGPCPLLEEGACSMYQSRSLICRTHGYPIANVYRGQRAIGFCHKNFKNVHTIPEDAVIDLAPLNHSLMEVNRQFTGEHPALSSFAKRLTIGEALLMEL